ncbi:YbdK family carboxylate-amine ligase [Streptomyces sp. RB6PN25]|uniref:Putative glutamate--cysteine ligase 2 n=1 Tax=Streptomyces humicola TaxID=2953240 RepID=A0ABT1Q148_9ACTN|nr:YbdK family carboxylate-amine ligase [Streptomyces humicola]
MRSQVEATTGVCTDLGHLAAQVNAGRQLLGAAAHTEGACLVSSGTPVLEGRVDLTNGRRYASIGRAYAGQTADYQVCGCHVHVGVPDRETAVAVVNHLRPWLPTLLALSVNSPFDRGRDSGYASWRILEQARFPGAGVPPWFDSAAACNAEVERLVVCGTLMDHATSFWHARPSPRWPTVEVRAADALGCVWETMLQAALVRALVRTALADLGTGREACRPSDQVAAAAVWSAARYGLSGAAVHPVLERRVPTRRLVAEMIDRIAPALEESGDLRMVRTALARLRARGTGAVRQRRAAAGGLAAVVDMLVAQTSQPDEAHAEVQTGPVRRTMK